jgi:hypothetical protein
MDHIVDFWQGGFTRYRLNLKIKKLKKSKGAKSRAIQKN